MATSSGLYGKMFFHTILREKIFSIILFLPKVHKENTPLRPIVSSIGSVSYGVSKEVARIIKPLVGSTEHHVNNSKEFIEEIRKMKLEGGNV